MFGILTFLLAFFLAICFVFCDRSLDQSKHDESLFLRANHARKTNRRFYHKQRD